MVRRYLALVAPLGIIVAFIAVAEFSRGSAPAPAMSLLDDITVE